MGIADTGNESPKRHRARFPADHDPVWREVRGEAIWCALERRRTACPSPQPGRNYVATTPTERGARCATRGGPRALPGTVRHSRAPNAVGFWQSSLCDWQLLLPSQVN